MRRSELLGEEVTNDVIVSNSLESRQEERAISDCICSSLRCRGCHSAVGKVIHSAPLHLDMVRSLFLLNKEHISCYIINSSSMVRASAFHFNLKALGESIEEVRQLFDEHLDQIVRIKSRLATRSEPCEFKQ